MTNLFKSKRMLLCIFVVALVLFACSACSSASKSETSSSTDNASSTSVQSAAAASAAAESSAAPSSASSASSDFKANFVGTWDMVGWETKDISYDEQELAEFRKMGNDSYATLRDDGTGVIIIKDQTSEFSWEASDAAAGSATFSGGTMPILIDNATLVFGDRKSEYFAFKKGKARPAKTESSSSSAAATPESNSSAGDSAAAGAVDPELKEWLDSYEAFMDEYVEFMQSYQESGDTMSMLTQYSDYMQRYADFAEKVDDLDTDNMSAADYAYYIEVTTRVSKKLLEASGY